MADVQVGKVDPLDILFDHDLSSTRVGKDCEGILHGAPIKSSFCTNFDVVSQSLAYVVLACLGRLRSFDLSLSLNLMSELTLLLVIHCAVLQASFVHGLVFCDEMLHSRVCRLAIEKALEGTNTFFMHTIEKLQASRLVFLDLILEALDSVVVASKLAGCGSDRKKLVQDFLLTDVLEAMHGTQRPSDL